MPILRVNNYIEAYRLRAQAEDIHELAARPDKKPVTEFVNRQILDTIQPGPDDFLVDIGCGDASLLRMAVAQSPKCVGTVGSVEEQTRLMSAFPDLSIIASRAQSLPLDSASASMIVCNGTLHYLPTEDDVKAALREMARIARPGATIWLGEIPEIDEYARHGIYRGNVDVRVFVAPAQAQWHPPLPRHALSVVEGANGERADRVELRRNLLRQAGKDGVTGRELRAAAQDLLST